MFQLQCFRAKTAPWPRNRRRLSVGRPPGGCDTTSSRLHPSILLTTEAPEITEGGTSSAETFQLDKFSVASVVSCSNPLGRARCPHRAECVYEHRRRCGDTPPQMEQEQTEMSDPPLCPSVSSVAKKKNDRRQATRRGVAAVGRYTPHTFTRPLLAPPVCATPPTPRRTRPKESGNGTRFWGPDSRHPGGTTARSVRASIDCGTRA